MGRSARRQDPRRQGDDAGLPRLDDEFCRAPAADRAAHLQCREHRRPRTGRRGRRLRLRHLCRAAEPGRALRRMGQARRPRRRRPHRHRSVVALIAAMIDATHTEPDPAAAAAALEVLDRFLAALNAGDEAGLMATMHFPHYRLAGVTMPVWEQPDHSYLSGFYARAGEGWDHTEWGFRGGIVARPGKGDLDLQITPHPA